MHAANGVILQNNFAAVRACVCVRACIGATNRLRAEEKIKKEIVSAVFKMRRMRFHDKTVFTFTNSHCSVHRRFRRGSSSSESDGWGVGGKPGRELASSSFFMFIPALFVFCNSLSPRSAATLNDDCNGSTCNTRKYSL